MPPGWQASAGVPSSVNDTTHQGRGVPDVAGNADPNSGYDLTYDGQPTGAIGGTSAVPPLYSGLIALINAWFDGVSGRMTEGYLNPTLYTKAPALGVFNDITCCGTNAFAGAPGYSVGTGWDAATGFGSINGQKLLGTLIPWHNLWHTMRRQDGSWSGLGDVYGEVPVPGFAWAVSAASDWVGGETQFLFTTADTHLWHTMK